MLHDSDKYEIKLSFCYLFTFWLWIEIWCYLVYLCWSKSQFYLAQNLILKTFSFPLLMAMSLKLHLEQLQLLRCSSTLNITDVFGIILLYAWGNFIKWYREGWIPLKSKVVPASMAASVTSHSCQVWGMSSPWHLSNLSYLKLSPPASRWLISPDTSHRPDRESLYPENNPPLLTLHPKSVPPPFISVFLIFLFTFSFPIYPFPITSLWPALSLMFPSVFVKPYSAPFLSFSIFPPPVFSSPSSLPR